MRTWIQYLLGHETARADFVAWIDEIKAKLTAAMAKAAEDGEMGDVTRIAMELKVYNAIGNIFRKEQREQMAQAEFDEKYKKE